MDFGTRQYGSVIPSHAFDFANTNNQQYTLDSLSALSVNGVTGTSGLMVMGVNYALGDFANSAVAFGPKYLYRGPVKWAGSGFTNFAFITGDGRLFTWGLSTSGLGRSVANNTHLVIRQVGTDTDWRSVSCGLSFMIATKEDGSLWSWGANTNGKTGLGLTSGTTAAPVRIGTRNDWSTIHSCGYEFAMIVDTSNNLYTFGTGVGTGSTAVNSTPILISTSLGTITTIHCNNVTAAIIADGKLYAAGQNANYATGIGTVAGTTLTFTQIGSFTDWVDVCLGLYIHGGIRSTTDGYWGWGSAGAIKAFSYDDSGGNILTPVQFRASGATGSGGKYLKVNCPGNASNAFGTVVIKADGTLVLNGTGNAVGLAPPISFFSDNEITKLPVATKYYSAAHAVMMVIP